MDFEIFLTFLDWLIFSFIGAGRQMHTSLLELTLIEQQLGRLKWLLGAECSQPKTKICTAHRTFQRRGHVWLAKIRYGSQYVFSTIVFCDKARCS